MWTLKNLPFWNIGEVVVCFHAERNADFFKTVWRKWKTASFKASILNEAVWVVYRSFSRCFSCESQKLGCKVVQLKRKPDWQINFWTSASKSLIESGGSVSKCQSHLRSWFQTSFGSLISADKSECVAQSCFACVFYLTFCVFEFLLLHPSVCVRLARPSFLWLWQFLSTWSFIDSSRNLFCRQLKCEKNQWFFNSHAPMFEPRRGPFLN